MKHIRLFLLVVLLLSAISSWAHDFEVGGIYYKILSKTDKTVAVTYKDAYNTQYVYNGAVIIPSYVTRYGVTYSVVAIGEKAFTQSGVSEVFINDGITTIGRGAFSGCTTLRSVKILGGVISIENNAFSGCSSLTSINLPKSVTSIGDYAFSSCSHLFAVDVPNSVASIGSGAFLNCSYLLYFYIPNSTTSIEASTFSGCSSLSFVNIPEGLTSIGPSTFQGCSNLTSVNIPYSVTSIGEKAFYGSGLTSIKIPNGVTSIEASTFERCSALTSVIIPHSVMSISKNAFNGCSKLISVTIPNGVTSIGESAFYNCARLTTLTIPNSVESIGSRAFFGNIKELRYAEGCTVALKTGMGRVSSVIIPSSVTSIEDYAFQDCSNLTSVTNLSLTPQPLKADCFTSYGTLHVLKGCKEAYANAEFWKNFTIVEDALQPCAAPTIDVVEGKLIFNCKTKDAVINRTITSIADDRIGAANSVVLSPFYFVTAYASADGYADSDVVSRTVSLTLGGNIKGDMNGDGKVDIQDAKCIMNKYLGK